MNPDIRAVLISGAYYLTRICYTSTGLVVYQQYITPGVNMALPASILMPSSVLRGVYSIPLSSLPVSFVSTLIYGM